MMRFLLRGLIIKVLTYSAQCAGITLKAVKEIDKEYKGDESWSKGKKEAIQTFIICITILLIISCLIS